MTTKSGDGGYQDWEICVRAEYGEYARDAITRMRREDNVARRSTQDFDADTLSAAMAVAKSIAAHYGRSSHIFEARRWIGRGMDRGCLIPVFYVRSGDAIPYHPTAHLPDPDVVGPPYSSPLLVATVRPTDLNRSP